jgi:hypothetical protein
LVSSHRQRCPYDIFDFPSVHSQQPLCTFLKCQGHCCFLDVHGTSLQHLRHGAPFVSKLHIGLSVGQLQQDSTDVFPIVLTLQTLHSGLCIPWATHFHEHFGAITVVNSPRQQPMLLSSGEVFSWAQLTWFSSQVFHCQKRSRMSTGTIESILTIHVCRCHIRLKHELYKSCIWAIRSCHTKAKAASKSTFGTKVVLYL